MKTPEELEALTREIRAGLAHAHEQNPVWRAVVALLDFQIEAATENVCSPAATDALAHFQRGDLAALREFRAKLQINRDKGMMTGK